MNRATGKRAGSTGVIPDSPSSSAGALSFGLNICTELWAVETYAAYAARGVQVILSPRATAAATTAKWLSVGVVAAVRSGAFSLSSNRVDPTGACGGVGWIITRTDTSWRGRHSTRRSRRSTSTCPPRRRRGTTIPRYVFGGTQV